MKNARFVLIVLVLVLAIQSVYVCKADIAKELKYQKPSSVIFSFEPYKSQFKDRFLGIYEYYKSGNGLNISQPIKDNRLKTDYYTVNVQKKIFNKVQTRGASYGRLSYGVNFCISHQIRLIIILDVKLVNYRTGKVVKNWQIVESSKNLAYFAIPQKSSGTVKITIDSSEVIGKLEKQAIKKSLHSLFGG